MFRATMNQLISRQNYLGVITALGVIAATVVAPFVATPSEFDFVYGCGTGCAIHVKQISPIYRATLNGKAVSKAKFFIVFTGAGRGNDNGSEQSFVVASCKEKKLAFVGANGKLDPWKKLTGTTQDYTTVAGGLGFYFERLCGTKRPS